MSHARGRSVNAALDWGDFPRLHAWTVGAGEPSRALLQRHGFVAEADANGGLRARSSGLLVRRLAAAGADDGWRLGRRNPLDIADWDLRMLYSMAG